VYNAIRNFLLDKLGNNIEIPQISEILLHLNTLKYKLRLISKL